MTINRCYDVVHRFESLQQEVHALHSLLLIMLKRASNYILGFYSRVRIAPEDDS